MRISNFLMAILALLVASTAAWGQVSTSQVSGVVQDQTGATVPDAQVQMTRTDTGLNRTAVTDANGYYVIPDLPVGPYRLNVTKQGFNAYVQTGIVLQVSSNPTLNVTLGIGAVSTEVSVEAGAQMVETESNGVGTVVDNQRIDELPLNGRQLTALIAISGGVTPAIGGDYNSNKNYPTFGANTVGGGPSGALSVAGGLPTGVTYLLDGGTHNDPFNNLNLPLPFPDATQEFKLETSSLPAQYGDHADAAVNVVTKSGTNSIHGDMFEFVRNYLFNAREADQSSRDSLKRNQYGATLGGPIKKDKLFYFMGFQGTIIKSNPTSPNSFVPTNLMLGLVPNDPNCAILPGSPTQCLDFTALTNPANNCTTATASTIGSATMRGAFGTVGTGYLANVAPLSALNPQGLALATAMLKGLPTTGPAATNLTLAQASNCGTIAIPTGANLNEQIGIGRMDYQISTKQTLYGRYLIGNSDQPLVGDAVLQVANKIIQKNRAQSATIGDTYTINSNTINSLHLTALRTRNIRDIAPFFDPASLGINDTAVCTPGTTPCGTPYRPGFTSFSIAGGVSAAQGATNPGYFNTMALQFDDDVDVIRGSHQITFGVNYIHTLMDSENSRLINGAFGFNSGSNSGGNSVTGLGYGDLLTGNLDSFSQGNPDLENDGQNYIGVYVQDSWKITRHLTINYGARWEPYLPMTNSNHHAVLFDVANFDSRIGSQVYPNAPAGLIFAGNSNYPAGDPGYPGDSYQSTKIDDIAPRFGIVWDPKGDGKMTIRAGYGIFYDSPYMFFGTRVSNDPPFGETIAETTAPNLGVTPYAGTAGGKSSLTSPWLNYPGYPSLPFPALNTLSPSITFPAEGIYVNYPVKSEVTYLEQYNLSIQKQIGSWLLSGTYIGSGTKHLPTAYEGDPGVSIPGVVGTNCTTGSAATLGGVFVGGPFNGIPDGLTSGAAGSPCSTTGNVNFRRVLYLNAPPPAPASVATELSNPTGNPGIFYNTIGTLDQSGVADYNGLLLAVQHRLSHNFQIAANWTYSHCLSDTETGTQNDLAGPTYEVPGYEHLSYANCDSDVRHVINISGVANTPKFENRFTNAIVGGWQFSPVITWRTGTYATVTLGSADFAESGIGGQIAEQDSTNFYSPNKGNFTAASCFLTPSNPCTGPGQTGATLFQVSELNNTSNGACTNAQGITGITSIGAWTCPGTPTSRPCSAGALPSVAVNGGTYACTPPDTVENPGLFEFDMALVRSFHIRESQTLQFRWEVFNITNTLNLGPISNAAIQGVAPTNFGISTTALNPRIMQFALKYVF